MVGRRLVAFAAASALAACNILTGSQSLSVDHVDASVPRVLSDASPSPIETIAPPEAGAPKDAFVEAAVDAGPPNIGTFNGHRYEVIVVDAAIEWNDAKNAAAKKGGHLATITSKAEGDFVTNLAIEAGGWTADGFGPWLGATKPIVPVDADATPPDPRAGWTWITGETWSYTNWDDGQPDNDDGDEGYLGFLGTPSAGAWNDYREAGDGYVLSYVIEYESP